MITSILIWGATVLGSDRALLSEHPEFQTVINPTGKLKAIKELIPTMAGSAAARFEIDPEVGELKVTLHVTERSLGWVLDQIADVLDLEWRESDGKFKLRISDAAKTEIARAKRERDERVQRDIRGQYLRIADQTRIPLAEAQSRWEVSAAGVDRLHAQRPPGWTELIQKATSERATYEVAGQESNQVLGYCIRQFGALFDLAMREGRLFLASTADLSGALRIDPKIKPHIREKGKDPSEDFEVLFAAVSDSNHLYFTAHTWSNSGAMWAELSHGLWSDVAKTTLSRAKGWGQTPEQVAELLPKSSFHTQSPLEARPNLTSSDVLVQAAEAMNIDLVADAFHDEWRHDLELPATTAGFWSELEARGSQFDVRVRNGAVLIRHEDYWELRGQEIPESKLEALGGLVRNGNVTLDAIATFVAGLTEPQRSAIGLHPPFRASEDLFGLSMSVDVLQFWNTLQPIEKERVLRHEVVAYDSLNPAAREAYRHLVLRGLATDFSGLTYSISEPFLALLSGKTTGLAFLVEPVRYRAATLEIDRVKVTVPVEEAAAGTSADRVWDALYFRFGTNAKNSILRVLDIPVKAAK